MYPRSLPGFLAEPQRRQWLDIARGEGVAEAWVPGRQGSGYEKLDLVAALADGTLGAQRPFAEAQVAAAREGLGVDSSNGWDAFLLRYREGAFVPEHRAPTTSLCHLRLNVLLLEASQGTGLLHLGGELFPLGAGDAVLFRPDVQPHQVTRVEGERHVLSVGCIFEREDP